MQRRAFFAVGTAAVAVGSTLAGPGGNRAQAHCAGHKTIPDVEVVTHDGQPARFYTDLVAGRVVTFNFMYTGCGGICPLVTANLLRVQELLGARVGHDIFMYSITLQPELDTPEVLRDYAAAHGVGPGWRFVTGRPVAIEAVRQALGFRSLDPELDIIADEHTGMLRYGNAALDRWAGGPAMGRPEWIVKAITTAMAVGPATAGKPPLSDT